MWQELTGETIDHAAYMARLYEIERRLALEGHKTIRVNATVDEVRARMAAMGLTNSTTSRAAALTQLARGDND